MRCKHGNSELIHIEYTEEQMKTFNLKNKMESRFFPCYCKTTEFGEYN